MTSILIPDTRKASYSAYMLAPPNSFKDGSPVPVLILLPTQRAGTPFQILVIHFTGLLWVLISLKDEAAC